MRAGHRWPPRTARLIPTKGTTGLGSDLVFERDRAGWAAVGAVLTPAEEARAQRGDGGATAGNEDSGESGTQ